MSINYGVGCTRDGKLAGSVRFAPPSHARLQRKNVDRMSKAFKECVGRGDVVFGNI